MLAPVGGRVRTPDNADAEDHARAIRELAQILPQELAHIRLTAIDLANDAVEALNRQSSDLDLMRHDASPAESDRLQLRLAALGPTRPDETGERAEMRGLLSNELELVWRMRDRLEVASGQRARRFDRLRNLYAVLCEACDGVHDSIDEWDAPAKAVAACADLRRELELPDA